MHENCEGSTSLTLRTRSSKKETIKNARKKLETSVSPAMPCKIMKKNCGSDGSNKVKTKLACILEADESTRLRMEIHYQIIMKTILQEKETIHYSIIIWYTFIPLPQAMKISAWNLTKVRSKKEVKQGRRAQKFISHH